MKPHVAALLLAAPFPAAADGVERILEEARAACASFESGRFDPGDALREVVIDRDGTRATMVDESGFACSSAASMYCGSGGCMLHAVVGEVQASWQAEGWRMIDWDGRPILLIARDGGWCGGAGAELCFEAVVWSHGRFLSVAPPG